MTATLTAPTSLSIQEAAFQLGVSTHTLRYYEREGLLSVPRQEVPSASARHAQRRYGDAELSLLQFLLALRATGMPMMLIRQYMDLVRGGEGTVMERRALLVAHQQQVAAQIEALQVNLGAIQHKIRIYDLTSGFAPQKEG